MNRKPGLPAERITEIALQLREIAHALPSISVEVTNAYNKSDARPFGDSLEATRRKLFRARLKLEGLACRQFGTDEGMRLANPARDHTSEE